MYPDILDKFDDEEPDPSILEVGIGDLDRGITDWKEFEQHLKRAFPSVKYLFVDYQNFGDPDHENSTLKVIEINHTQSSLPPSDITPIYEKITEDVELALKFSLRVHNIDDRLIISHSDYE